MESIFWIVALPLWIIAIAQVVQLVLGVYEAAEAKKYFRKEREESNLYDG